MKLALKKCFFIFWFKLPCCEKSFDDSGSDFQKHFEVFRISFCATSSAVLSRQVEVFQKLVAID
eukprot:snap_masked-scaffold_11-processed-gene-5.20-mRNA-1 protein AED:1.00 eAED:1.00 QI:0/0/0/0/1/1/2/0/63